MLKLEKKSAVGGHNFPVYAHVCMHVYKKEIIK